MIDKESLWKEFNASLDMYKFYVDSIVKIGVFSFTVTGAIASYYLANTEKPLLYLSLVLPLLINGGFLAILLSSIDSAEKLRTDHITIESSLELDGPFEMRLLTYLMKIFSVYYAIISIGLLLLLINH